MKRNICLFKVFPACFFLLLAGVTGVLAQSRTPGVDDSILDSVDVFLLTCQPHDEVYSLYGHTAIRVQDRNSDTDVAVNFGVFDSTADFFVLRFLFGLTDYMMAVTDFDRFLMEYRYYGSGVYQQHINMSRREKAAFLSALYETSRPENVVYRYDFLNNNCTTKARDLILAALDGEIRYPATFLQRGDRTMRELIHGKNEHNRWARVGNDIVLGVYADTSLCHAARQFLPEVLMNDFDSAVVVAANGKQRQLVDTAGWVLLPGASCYSSGEWQCPLSPKMMAVLFFCAILSLCLVQLLLLKRPLLWLNYCMVLIYGLAGIILGAMIFSKHPTVNVNLQILVLNPLLIWLMYPRLRFRWRYHIVYLCIAAFYAGNVIQSYAEGMNIMALSLLLIVTTGFLFDRFGHLTVHVKQMKGTSAVSQNGRAAEGQ